MNVKSVEKLEHSAVELDIEVSKEEFEAAVEKVYRKQRGNIAVPGFRKGKAPRKIIEGMYGSGVFYEDAVNDLYPTAYAQALEQEKLDVVSYPSVEITQVGKDGFQFKAKVTVRPTLGIKDYKGLTVTRPAAEISEDDLEAELKPFITRATRIVTAERAAKLGDVAVIDYEGFDNGVPFEGGKGEGHELELGSGSFIPGFEGQVVGLSAGDEKDIEVTFPEEYHAKELAGKPVVFKVKVHEVKERIAPELDDDFAQDVSEFDTLADLKKDLADKLTERKEKEADQALEEGILAQLGERLEGEIPEPMVEYQADKMVDDYAMRISNQGIPFEQYLNMMGMTREAFRKQAEPAALRQIQARLALEAVAAAEGLAVSDQEADEEIAKLAGQYGMEEEKVRQFVPVEDVKGDLLRQKAMKLVKDSAVIEAPKAEEAEAGEAKTEEAPAKPKRKSTKKAADKAEDAPEE